MMLVGLPVSELGVAGLGKLGGVAKGRPDLAGKFGQVEVGRSAKGVGGADSVAGANASGIEALAANDVRFSQNTVSYNKVDRITGEKYTYDDLVQSMKTSGWKGDPVDVVKMPDGAFTSMDNTRISAARDAGINVQANVRGFNDPLPADMIANRRFGDATTWGEALTGRISNQRPPSFGNANPNGSPTPPKVTGKP
jgi:filamentous hemagglutinin